MNENAVKNYATWARRELMAEVERRCALFGISDDKDCKYDAESVGGRVLTYEERRMRRELVGEAKRGMPALVERAAYTWFNRMLAIRFMECNDRLPSHTRMFSAPDGSFAPQALKEALSVEIDGIDRQRVASLVQAGDDEALFRYLLLLQCDELADCMPAVFDKVGEDPLVLLLPDGLLRSEGVIGKLVADISEDDWRDGVQIVGWMYQFYISEKKDAFFASKRKATADDIPAATQLFTPEWIVQYLVQNSLGRLWMLNRPSSRLAEQMDYFIAPDADTREEFQHVSSPEEITLIDPACGSGHILVYAFDLLAAIYEECGYSRRDIPRLILEKNLTGVEIDRRAGALASFALAMKACEYDGRFLRRGVLPRITVLEKVELGQEHIDAINSVRADATKDGEPFLLDRIDLLDALAHLDEVGSLFTPSDEDMAALRGANDVLIESEELFAENACELVKNAFAELVPLHITYSLSITNPPYMNSGKMNEYLSSWVRTAYPSQKSDLCTCFITRCISFTTRGAYLGLITASPWMFKSSFADMRMALLKQIGMKCLIQQSMHGFPGVTVPTCIFVAQRTRENVIGTYINLADFDRPAFQKPRALEAIQNPHCTWRYERNARFFDVFPDGEMLYWASLREHCLFDSAIPLSGRASFKKGFSTGNNDVYLRAWWEVSRLRAALNEQDRRSLCKWFPYDKGGEYRKWYGNNELTINWQNNGAALRADERAVLRNVDSVFRPSIVWSTASSGIANFRFKGDLHLHDGVSGAIYEESVSLLQIMALLNSSVGQRITSLLSPISNFEIGQVSQFPFINSQQYETSISELGGNNLSIVKADYDAFETSWDFKVHPFVGWSRELWDVTSIGATMHHFYGSYPEVGSPLELCYMLWQGQCRERFDRLKASEEELNRIFARIYGMEGEVPIEVSDDKVSVRLADKTRDIKSLISYAVGCMLGRYSLDVEGLVLANQGDGLAEYLAKVPEPTFVPDDDGIIPITDTEYFHDDATGFFVDFVRTVYGEESLEENLAFVADALGGSGTPRESIREYFMNGFFADHCKTYQKRPIYWLFDSGKKGGFRALVYMHRYKPDLLAKLRTDYVHEQQDRYRTQIEHIDDALETADRRQQAELKKRRKKLSEQLDEISAFEEKVHHLADQMIEIDLDDGVKVNYAKFQDVLAKIK